MIRPSATRRGSRIAVAGVLVALTVALVASCGSGAAPAPSSSRSAAGPASTAAAPSPTVAPGSPAAVGSSSAPSGASAGTGGASASAGGFVATVQDADRATLGAVEPDTTLHRQVPASIRDSGVLRIGTRVTAPESFYAPGTTNLIGDETTLARAIARTLGLNADFRVVPSGDLFAGLAAKRFDLAIGALKDTKAQQKTVTFLDYYSAGIGIVVRKGNPADIGGPASLCGRAVSVRPGTVADSLVRSQSQACTHQGGEPIGIVSAGGNEELLADLQGGRVAACLTDTPTAAFLVAQHPAALEQAAGGAPLDAVPYGIGFPKGTTALVTAVQGALNKLIDDGTYGKIMTSWGLQSGALTAATIDAGK